MEKEILIKGNEIQNRIDSLNKRLQSYQSIGAQDGSIIRVVVACYREGNDHVFMPENPELRSAIERMISEFTASLEREKEELEREFSAL